MEKQVAFSIKHLLTCFSSLKTVVLLEETVKIEGVHCLTLFGDCLCIFG